MTGKFTCKNATSETVNVNLPSCDMAFPFTARDNINGNLVTIWYHNGQIQTYNHTGTMTVGNGYAFSFSFIPK